DREIGHHMTPSVARAKPDAHFSFNLERRSFNARDQLFMRERDRAVVQSGARCLCSEVDVEGAYLVHHARSNTVTTVAASSTPRKPPPFSAAASRAPSTCRAPASPRSCVTNSKS